MFDITIEKLENALIISDRKLYKLIVNWLPFYIEE